MDVLDDVIGENQVETATRKGRVSDTTLEEGDAARLHFITDTFNALRTLHFKFVLEVLFFIIMFIEYEFLSLDLPDGHEP